MTHMELTRRSFVVTTAAAGGGLLLGIASARAMQNELAPPNAQPWLSPTDKAGTEINAWVSIDPAGICTIQCPHTEQGQGAMTSIPMMVNEELQADWKSIRVQFADVRRHVLNDNEYVSMSTAGSAVVRARRGHTMQAGASARERLKAAAAAAWGVDASTVATKDGVMSSGNNSGTYGEFATAAASIQLSEEPAVRTPDEFTFLGTSVSRLEIPLKVNGSAAYTIDTRLPGMLYAATAINPVINGGSPDYDADAIMDRPGVVAVVELSIVPGKKDSRGRALRPDHLQNSVSVVADSWYRARTALDLMPTTWDYGPSVHVSWDGIKARAAALLQRPGEVSSRGQGPIGDALGVVNASNDVLEGFYIRPYETHARMEPINAVASVTASRVDLWTPSHNQAGAHGIAQDQLGFGPEQVYVHTAFLGGQFGAGGSGATQVTRQVLELSKEVGAPVKLVWSRDDDIGHDTQREPCFNRFRAVLGNDGLPTAFTAHTMGSDRAYMPYAIPNYVREIHPVESHVIVGSHRAPGTNNNIMTRESFVDEMALKGGWDPLEFRIELLKHDPEWSLVVNAIKDLGVFTTDLPRGEGMGIAIGEDHATLASAIAHVTVSRRGQMRVEKVWNVNNLGHEINPLGVAQQSEGAAVWEMAHAQSGGLDLRNGRFINTNYDNYHLMRIADMFVHETHSANSRGERWGGAGEPSGPVTPGAVANAIFFATGVRVRSSPINAWDLSWS